MNSGIYSLTAWKAGLKDHAQLKVEMAANNDWQLTNDAFGELARWKMDDVGNVIGQGKRLLGAVGDQGDNVEGAKDMARYFREKADGEDMTEAYLVKGAVHAWDLQFPTLFAQGIRAWIGGRPLPAGFETLLDA